MSISFGYSNEVMASEAFSKQALLFDKLYGDNKIIQYKRQRVRNHILKNLGSKSSAMLELNCGTGEDALFFAAQRHEVHATDISSGMLDVLRKKIQDNPLKNKITIEECSFTQVEFLKRGTFDEVAYAYRIPREAGNPLLVFHRMGKTRWRLVVNREARKHTLPKSC